MRIEGYIPHPLLKITVFKMNNRLSLKIESGLYELTYKFRPGTGVESLEDIKRLVDDSFLEGAQKLLQAMHQQKMIALQALKPDEERPFDEII